MKLSRATRERGLRYCKTHQRGDDIKPTPSPEPKGGLEPLDEWLEKYTLPSNDFVTLASVVRERIEAERADAVRIYILKQRSQ